MLRLPNVFTALADVLAGFLFTHADLTRWPLLALLAASSAAMYVAGMVLNDVYDVDVDARERPARPLPSGRVPLGLARAVGFELLLVGLACGWAAAFVAGTWRPGLVATLLAATVWSYDAWAKRTAAGPLFMGACRGLNLLLGMSVASFAWHEVHLVVATALGIYIAGLTWFARREAVESRRGVLAAATCVVAAGLALLAAFPQWADARLDPLSQPVALGMRQWWLLVGVLGVLIVRRFVAAVVAPSPLNVQRAVKDGILSLVVLDAAIVAVARGPWWSVPVLLLLLPALWLSRRLAMT